MSEPKGASRRDPSTTAAPTVAESENPHVEVAEQLLADATQAQAAHDQDDARADDWGRASFPASDPPQNY